MVAWDRVTIAYTRPKGAGYEGIKGSQFSDSELIGPMTHYNIESFVIGSIADIPLQRLLLFS